METPLTEHARACSWVIASARNSTQGPYQLTLLSPIPDGEIEHESASDDNHRHNQKHCGRPRRRRACRHLTAADVAPFDANNRAPLTRADADIILDTAIAILHHRLRRGVKILRDPRLLLRFLQLRLVSQPRPVFAVFFLDRHQQLIRFAELFHGQSNTIVVHPKEVVREAIACNAEQILCVRSDPQGDEQPTPADAESAQRVTRAMNLLQIPVLDYLIMGTSVTSLRARGVLHV